MVTSNLGATIALYHSSKYLSVLETQITLAAADERRKKKRSVLSRVMSWVSRAVISRSLSRNHNDNDRQDRSEREEESPAIQTAEHVSLPVPQERAQAPTTLNESRALHAAITRSDDDDAAAAQFASATMIQRNVRRWIGFLTAIRRREEAQLEIEDFWSRVLCSKSSDIESSSDSIVGMEREAHEKQQEEDEHVEFRDTTESNRSKNEDSEATDETWVPMLHRSMSSESALTDSDNEESSTLSISRLSKKRKKKNAKSSRSTASASPISSGHHKNQLQHQHSSESRHKYQATPGRVYTDLSRRFVAVPIAIVPMTDRGEVKRILIRSPYLARVVNMPKRTRIVSSRKKDRSQRFDDYHLQNTSIALPRRSEPLQQFANEGSVDGNESQGERETASSSSVVDDRGFYETHDWNPTKKRLRGAYKPSRHYHNNHSNQLQQDSGPLDFLGGLQEQEAFANLTSFLFTSSQELGDVNWTQIKNLSYPRVNPPMRFHMSAPLLRRHPKSTRAASDHRHSSMNKPMKKGHQTSTESESRVLLSQSAPVDVQRGVYSNFAWNRVRQRAERTWLDDGLQPITTTHWPSRRGPHFKFRYTWLPAAAFCRTTSTESKSLANHSVDDINVSAPAFLTGVDETIGSGVRLRLIRGVKGNGNRYRKIPSPTSRSLHRRQPKIYPSS